MGRHPAYLACRSTNRSTAAAPDPFVLLLYVTSPQHPACVGRASSAVTEPTVYRLVRCSSSQTPPRGVARFILLLDVRGGGSHDCWYPQGDEPLIPMPALSLPALRQAVATVAPSRLPEFFQEIQDAFTQAGDETVSSPSATSTSAGAPPSPSSGGLGCRPAPCRRTSPRRPRPHCPGPGNSGSRRDRPGGLPRGRSD